MSSSKIELRFDDESRAFLASCGDVTGEGGSPAQALDKLAASLKRPTAPTPRAWGRPKS